MYIIWGFLVTISAIIAMPLSLPAGIQLSSLSVALLTDLLFLYHHHPAVSLLYLCLFQVGSLHLFRLVLNLWMFTFTTIPVPSYTIFDLAISHMHSVLYLQTFKQSLLPYLLKTLRQTPKQILSWKSLSWVSHWAFWCSFVFGWFLNPLQFVFLPISRNFSW